MSGPSRRAIGLGAFCFTVTISYGVLYYAFPVLADAIVADTGWSRTAVTAAFSIGSLVGAITGVAVGRIIAQHGPRAVMSWASALGTAAMLGVGYAPSYPAFFAAWLMAGASTAGLYYAPAFAALTAWYGTGRVRALTALTLVAGFSSTIFAPLTAVLASHLSWRATYGVLAVLLGITLPVHLWALRLPWPFRDRTGAAHADRAILRSRRFLLLTGASALATLVSFAALVELVPLLTGRGLSSTAAAWALGLGGAGQVLGRLLYAPLTRVPVRARTVGIMLALGGMVLLLGAVPGPASALITLSIAAGAVRGLFTLLQATAVSDRWGIESYASLNGVYNLPISAASALAPICGTALAAALGGYGLLFVALAALALLAAAVAAAADRSDAEASGRATDGGSSGAR